MGKTTYLRQQIKLHFIPIAQSHDFELDMRDAPTFFTFRRLQNNNVQVFDLQFDKYGKNKFALNFGFGDADNLMTYDGKTIAPEDACVHDMPTRGRIQAARKPLWSNSNDTWFCKDISTISKLLLSPNVRSIDVIQDLLSGFEILCHFFETEQIDKRVKLLYAPH